MESDAGSQTCFFFFFGLAVCCRRLPPRSRTSARRPVFFLFGRAAGRWNSDSTSLSWAQAQSTHHPNAKTNLPSAPVRAAATGSGTAILLAQ